MTSNGNSSDSSYFRATGNTSLIANSLAFFCKAFGSFGWGDGAVKEIIEQMKAAKIDILDEKIEIKFVPKPEDLDFKEIVDKLIEKMD